MYTIPIHVTFWKHRYALHHVIDTPARQQSCCSASWQSSVSCTDLHSEMSDKKSLLCPTSISTFKAGLTQPFCCHPQLHKILNSNNSTFLRRWKVEAKNPTTSVHRAKIVITSRYHYRSLGSCRKAVYKWCWRLNCLKPLEVSNDAPVFFTDNLETNLCS